MKDTNVENINKIDANMQLKFNKYIHGPHLHINML